MRVILTITSLLSLTAILLFAGTYDIPTLTAPNSKIIEVNTDKKDEKTETEPKIVFFVEKQSEPKEQPKVDNTVKKEAPAKKEILVLEDRNSLNIRGPVTAQSVGDWSNKLLKMSHTLKASETIYLVMDTPGGSVLDGNQFIDLGNSIPQKIVTVTLFSASMGFQIVQNFDERYITPNGTLMSHRASGGFRGSFGSDGKGELNSQLNWIMEILKRSDLNASKRMKISYEDYMELIRDEFWTTGDIAVEKSAADKVANVTCGRSLVNAKENLEIKSFFGSLKLTFSKCPLISAPLDVKMEWNASSTEAQKNDTQIFYNRLLFDKKTFVQKYITTGEFDSFLK
jgi:ATP-dependent protease ClpP protease subunit